MRSTHQGLTYLKTERISLRLRKYIDQNYKSKGLVRGNNKNNKNSPFGNPLPPLVGDWGGPADLLA